jgi:glycine/D-amino acid oxidase-like deaminating enzyme
MTARAQAGGDSLWQAGTAAQPAWSPARGGIAVDLVIIGAGYTGLSAALRAAEAGLDVAVLDSHAPGWGGSGRNGGQVIAGLKYDPEALERMLGAPAGRRLADFAGRAPGVVFDLIARHGMACEAVRNGWLQLAISEANLGVLRERARQWQARGVGMSLFGRDEAARLTGSPLYAGGALDPRGGTLHPLAYAWGLARAAERAGARIYGQSPALHLRRRGDGWEVTLPAALVQARRVILATNAYGGQLWPALRRSVVALPSFQIASDPLPPDLRRQILPERHAGSDMRRLLRYFRLDSTGRLIMGGRGGFGRQSPEQALQRHLADVREIFPQAAGLAFPYQWGGLVAMTADHLPHVHELAPGLLTGLGYNGRGVALATAIGQALGAWAAGGMPEDLPVTRLTPMRLHALSGAAARATVQWLRWRDALDRH